MQGQRSLSAELNMRLSPHPGALCIGYIFNQLNYVLHAGQKIFLMKNCFGQPKIESFLLITSKEISKRPQVWPLPIGQTVKVRPLKRLLCFFFFLSWGQFLLRRQNLATSSCFKNWAVNGSLFNCSHQPDCRPN